MAFSSVRVDSMESLPESLSSSSLPPTINKPKEDLFNDILKCGICLSRMSSPCCLPCAHSFCRSCLIDYAQNYGNNNNNKTNQAAQATCILCPYCKYQLNFRSLEHFESMLVINPTLTQICEALDTSKLYFDQQQTAAGGACRARCHTCGLLQILKICKHCNYMICDACRQAHLLEVHRETKAKLDSLLSRIQSVNKKRSELKKRAEEYNELRQRIDDYLSRLANILDQQRNQVLHTLDERHRANEDLFWAKTGFDNEEKLNFFISLLQTGQQKLVARNITDKDLMELSENLQTMPDINEKLLGSVQFSKVNLQLDESLLTKQFIRVADNQPTTNNNNNTQNLPNGKQQTDCPNS